MTDDAQVVRRQMISPAEAAQMLRVAPKTIRDWIRDGRLPATKLTRRTIRIRVADIERLIEVSAIRPRQLDGNTPAQRRKKRARGASSLSAESCTTSGEPPCGISRAPAFPSGLPWI